MKANKKHEKEQGWSQLSVELQGRLVNFLGAVLGELDERMDNRRVMR